MAKKLKTIEDLTPDPHNANLGTERGQGMLEYSLRQYGAGRSILADKNGKIIAGNKTLDSAADLEFPIRVIETNGKELVVVQRMDLDLDHDPAARELAYADNRVGQVDLNFDLDRIAADVAGGIDISHLWTDAEVAKMLEDAGVTVDQSAVEDASAEVEEIAEKYMIVIECSGEGEQTKLLERFLAEGLNCRALAS